MNITIVGGGHIGTTLACYIKYFDPNHIVSLFTQRPNLFSNILKCNDLENAISYEVKLDLISNDPAASVFNADIIFIALPHFAIEKAFADIAPYIKPGVFIGVIPGGGGCEFFFNKYFANKATLFGFQRVPFTAKLVEYGKETNLKSWKAFSVIGTFKNDSIDRICKFIRSCGLNTKKAPNYLSIALTPTNPILHTARIYEIFKSFDRDYKFNLHSKFYVGWTDFSSQILLSMDAELHTLLNAITEIDTSAIRPLTEHYEAPTIEAITNKINSIPTFQTVYAPMIQNNDGTFSADLSSRMFTEDFPWGLAIIRAYCEIIGTSAPTMDEVLGWYADYMGLEWFVNGKFCGKDLIFTGIPQRYGIDTKEKLLAHYYD